MTIRIIYPRWYFPYNLGDTVMLSSVFQAIHAQNKFKNIHLITDTYTANTFFNDPYVNKITGFSKFQSKFLSKKLFNIFKAFPNTYVIWPGWHQDTFRYLRSKNNLQNCINSLQKNILSINYAIQIDSNTLNHPDLRPRIYLTKDEESIAKIIIPNNTIGIHIAKIRNSQTRNDHSKYRYNLEHWRTLCRKIKVHLPHITIFEIGSDEFLGIGDQHIGFKTIRETAALINQMDLVILSDGGIHNICNAIDKKVLLFQAYEWNPAELFKMGNAIFDSSCHLSCSTKCHLLHEIKQIKDERQVCNRECYQLDPRKLASTAINFLKKHYAQKIPKN